MERCEKKPSKNYDTKFLENFMYMKEFLSQKCDSLQKIWQKFYIFEKFLSQKLGKNFKSVGWQINIPNNWNGAEKKSSKYYRKARVGLPLYLE